MGLFGKKKKDEEVESRVEAEVSTPVRQEPAPQPRVNPYATNTTFVPVEYTSRVPVPQDPLEAAAQRKQARDKAMLDAIFQAFGKMLPTYGTSMKKYAPLTTSDYEFNEGNYNDRYKDIERQIKVHMEERGWKVKEFRIKDGKERSKSTLSKYYPLVRWSVMEPGSFKVKS